MNFTVERLVSHAMLIFKDRLVSVLCNSPLHDHEVAVVELVTVKPSYEGSVCLRDIIAFAGMVNLDSSDIFIREQSEHTLELWLFSPEHDINFDEDPTPVNMAV